MKESDLSERIADWATKHGVFWQRFEDAAQRGIPDGYLGVSGLGAGWVELKRITSPTEKPRYRPGQLPWAVRARELGQRPTTLCVVGEGAEFRVLDTAAIGRAEVLGQDWPGPILTSQDLDDALIACMGLRRLPWLP
jgi:hypothetical protein